MSIYFQVFFPTNFEHYIAQMELRDADQNVVDPNPTAETLITGPQSKDLHLNTRTDIDCVHCYDDAFFGLPVDQVRTFAQCIGIFALAYPVTSQFSDIGFLEVSEN